MILRTLVALLLVAAPVSAEVVRIEVKSRADVLAGQAFGATGPYEKLSGTIYFAIDPRNPANQIIADIDKAPQKRRRQGGVLVGLLSDQAEGCRRAATAPCSTKCRIAAARAWSGSSTSPRAASIRRPRNSSATASCSSRASRCCGSAGSSIVPLREGLVRVYRADRQGSRRPRRSQGWCAATSSSSRPATRGLARRSRSPGLSGVRSQRSGDVLTVRDSVEGARRTIPRDQWQFTDDGKSVRMAAGFEPKKIYEVVYRAQDPPVVGVGPAAMRDTISKIKYGGASELGLAQGAIKRAHRVRHLAERPLSAHLSLLRLQRRRVAPQGVRRRDAARRGQRPRQLQSPLRAAVARRASRTSTSSTRPTSFRSPTPSRRDPETGVTDGLLTHATKPAFQPNIFYTNSSYEYWGRAASLYPHDRRRHEGRAAAGQRARLSALGRAARRGRASRRRDRSASS